MRRIKIKMSHTILCMSFYYFFIVIYVLFYFERVLLGKTLKVWKEWKFQEIIFYF